LWFVQVTHFLLTFKIFINLWNTIVYLILPIQRMMKRITWTGLWKDSICCLLMLSLLRNSILIWKILSLLLHFKSLLTSAWNLFLTGSIVLKLWATWNRLILRRLSILWATSYYTFWRWNCTWEHKILKITYNSLFS